MSSNIHYEHYLPVVLAALTVLLLGCWNPKGLQEKDKDLIAKQAAEGGTPSYKWLALFALIVGMLAVWCYNQQKHN